MRSEIFLCLLSFSLLHEGKEEEKGWEKCPISYSKKGITMRLQVSKKKKKKETSKNRKKKKPVKTHSVKLSQMWTIKSSLELAKSQNQG